MHSEDSTPVAVAPVPTDDEVREWARADAAGQVGHGVAEWLRLPENLDRWRSALRLEAQQIQGAYIDWRAKVRAAKAESWSLYRATELEYATWCARTQYRTQAINGRISECRRLQRERDEARHAAFKGSLETRLDSLEFEVTRLRRSLQVVADEVSR